ncbi:amidohydrolase family protein [Bordetella sp. FB-8]|uniref:amidohydrolase family protein n=1 Tax=Bordetella sp. FB-8 TaxID=1159870 RepID=UPI00036E1609|nr:amidohydrolase family protein [Bordetella sp. FB-8]
MATFAYTSTTTAPRTVIARRACDCHVHIYDSRFPAAPTAKLVPPDASAAQYRALQQCLGLQRAVLVTPSTYGYDNRAMLQGLAQLGQAARGVAVIDGTQSDAQLLALHEAGVRGIRLNLSLGVANTLDDLQPLARRVKDLGWHIQLLMPPSLLAQIADRLRRLPVQLVFDHMGRINPGHALRHPALRQPVFRQPAHAVLMALLRDGLAWVKLSGGYIVSDIGRADDPDLDDLARSYIDAAPDRVVWGSDWPHATASAGMQPMPDDALQLDRLSRWAGDAATLERILVTNPARLYGFAAEPTHQKEKTWTHRSVSLA